MKKHSHKGYQRYHIETKTAHNLIPHPHRFKVKVKKLGLAKLLLKEFFHYKGNMDVILSRPCVYGVFSGPVGGFAPREQLCVGCLRCTTQYPEMVSILRNPQRSELGDDYFTPDYIDTVIYEAENGRVPVKGAGYRGKFGGEGWDSMWTDMSEIVRPTRDGIHGREFISTEIDLGEVPPYLQFDSEQHIPGDLPKNMTIPLPLLFDCPPSSVLLNKECCHILSAAAAEIQTFAILPLHTILLFSLAGSHGSHLIPLLTAQDFKDFRDFGFSPLAVEMGDWSESFYSQIKARHSNSLIILRADYESEELISAFQKGVRIFHLTADYHGQGKNGQFVMDLIRRVHLKFVEMGCRDQVTLLGSGGMVAAEHIPKAIICGLDAVALDTPVMAALQAKFYGKCASQTENNFVLPDSLTIPWGKQRLKNLAGAWRDQLLEVMGAMGLREVRRLRGEMGRAMLQKDLEAEAFAGITQR